MNPEDQRYYIPRYLDEPMRIILWSLDELVSIFLPCAMIYLIFDALITGLVAGFGCLYCLRKVKGNQGHYFFKNLIYWHFPTMKIYRKTPPSYIRSYIG